MPKNRRSHVHLLAALAVGSVLATAGCAAAGGEPADSEEPPLVLATFTVLADVARNVAGEHLEVESITKPGAEIHGYEPTPGDLRRASEAALIVDNGLGLEAWFAKFVESAEAPHVVVSDGVETIDITGDAYAGKPNPHAWMSPLNVQQYVANLVAAFSELAPEHADAFAANGAAYSAKLQAVQDRLVAELSTLPASHRALVTCEGAFSYLARDAGLTEAYLWPVNAEQQATAKQIAEVIAFVEEHEVPAVFCESTVSDQAMQQVVAATDAEFGGVLYVDSLSAEGGPVPSYLSLIEHDADTIIAALKGSER
jgi:manganese transport system substrate-binding protein